MPTYSVTITEDEDKSLRAIILDPQKWLEDAFSNKVRKCVDRVIESYTDKRAKALLKVDKVKILKDLDIIPREK